MLQRYVSTLLSYAHLFRAAPLSIVVLTLALGLVLGGAHSVQAQTVYHVTEAGDDSNSGASFSDSDALSLQGALDMATGNDVIVIAAGTYTPGGSADDRFAITGAQDGLKVYGGWSGSTSFSTIGEVEAALDGRNFSSNETTLSGSNTNYTVVYLDGTSGGTITTDTILDGLTITEGRAGEGSQRNPENRGGGLYCDGSGNGNECSPILTALTFTGNRATSGAAIYNNGFGGGTSSPVITNATFQGNIVEGRRDVANHGGAIYNDGESGTSSPRITNGVFVENKAMGAGASLVERSGGAIYNNGLLNGMSSPQIANSVFVSNEAVGRLGRGGAIYNAGSENGTSSPQIINTTFTRNDAQERGGAVYNNGDGDSTVLPQITNAILWDNTAGGDGNQIFNEDATPTLAHTLIEDGVNGGGVDGDPNNDGGNNLDTDPLFVDANNPAGADGTFGTDDDGLRLSDTSPAIDAGDNSIVISEGIDTDLSGNDRIQNGTVDLGAYERVVDRFIYHVNASATGNADGSSWDDAFTDLQDALATATENDVIVIAAGRYLPTGDTSNRDARFEITGDQDGLKVYGGWSGSESFTDISDVESTLDDRDLAVDRTVLSGDIDGNDTTTDGITEEAEDIDGENSYTVVYLDGTTGGTITDDTVLDGLVITGGQANVTSGNPFSPSRTGGGVHCDGDGSGNGCSPQLINTIFAGNFADVGGGALYTGGEESTSTPQITNATFTGNATSGSGGAIYNNGIDGVSSPSITGSVFTGNSSAGFRGGGAIYNDGVSGTSSPQITNTIFVGNVADAGGGALYNEAFSGTSSPEITNTTFINNSAVNGGAIYNGGESGTSSPVVINSILWGNSASDSGSEIFNTEATPTLAHTLIEGGLGGISENNGSSTTDGDDNLDADPLFVDAHNPAGLDEILGTEDDGLRLAANSPAVDAGNNSEVPSGVSTDLIGDARIQDGTGDGTATVNMGAYETPELPIATSVTITGADGLDTDAGWRIVSTPYDGAVAGDVRMASSAGTNTLRFNRNVFAVWDDSDPDESTGGTGAYDVADASTPLPLANAALLYLEDDARDPVESSGLTIRLSENTSGTRHGLLAVERNDLTQSARWHLLGNPYPTDYALSALTTGGSALAGNGFQEDAQVYDATDGTWQLLNTQAATLPAWQGAFIERSDPGTGPTAVTFDPSGRTAPDESFIGSAMQGPPAAASSVQRGTLWLEGVVTDASNNTVATDQAIGIRFHENATTGWDAWDTSKLAPLEAPSVVLSAQGTGSSGNNVAKAVESRPWPEDTSDPDADLTTVPIAVQGTELPEDGTLTLQVREWDLPDTWAAELVDTKDTLTESDNETVPLEPGMAYTVDVSSLNDTPETERFIVQIAPNSSALPVELAGFEAQRSGSESVTLQWQTLSETNNAGFEVQRAVGSVNGSVMETSGSDVSTWESWDTIATLDGAGTTDEPQSYRFDDTQLPYAADSLSYRLRQIDTDGTESFSEAVVITRPVTEAKLLPTYPNPARSQATIRFAVPRPQAVRIDLYDLLGRRVQTVVHGDTQGRTEARLDVSRLSSGTYFLRMQSEGYTETQRLIVVR